MKSIRIPVIQCMNHALDTKRILHEAMTDTDFQSAKDLHKCFELTVELEVRYQILLDRIHDGKKKL